MKNIIVELWHAIYVPKRTSVTIRIKMKSLMEYMTPYRNSILKTLSNAQRKIFNRFDDCRNEYASLAKEAILVYAFHFGTRLPFDALEYIAQSDACKIKHNISDCSFEAIENT